MRLLYVMSHPSDRLADERAGHVVRPRQLIQGLRANGVEVDVVEAAGSATAQAAASSYWAVRDRLPRPLALGARDAVRVLQNERFARRALAAARAADVLLETQVAFSTAGARLAARTGRPLVLDDVSPVEEDEEVYDVQLRTLARRRRRACLQAAALVVCTSSAIRDGLVAEGVEPQRLEVVPNGVPSTATRPASPEARAVLRQQLGLPEAHVVVAYSGSFQAFHRVDLLVEALALPQVPARVRLLLVGDGDERGAVERRAQELGVSERVLVTGRVASEDVARHLHAADAAVLPATAAYTNPMKLYDYLAAGLPVVAPRQRAVEEVLGDTPAALFAPGSAQGLADALLSLAGDTGLRGTLADASRAAGEQHTWDRRASQLVEALARRHAV